MKFSIVFLLVANLLAAPASYNVYKTATPMTIDADLSDWSAPYYIDTLYSDDNVICRDVLEPWTTEEFNGELYVSWDSTKIYFAVKMFNDDVYCMGGTNDLYKYDVFKINPGGQAAAFYLASDGHFHPNPNCPYKDGISVFHAVNSTGNNNLPVYEWSLDKAIADPFGMGQFQLSVGAEENDVCGTSDDQHFLGFGIEYTGNKQDWSSSPWDNPAYYPTYYMIDTIPNAVEKYTQKRIAISVYPNPFCTATDISFATGSAGKGMVSIYNIRGERVFSRHVEGRGRLRWDAGAQPSGVYVLRTEMGRERQSRKLLLQK